MDDEYAKPRDVETDLAEITSRLGEPDATYRTNPSSVFWRFAFGVLIVVAAAALHYLMWTGEVPWPGKRIKLWVVLIASMFVVPGIGLYLITFAVRGMKLWVLAYPTGLFVWHRGRVLAFPWEEIRAVQIAGLPIKAILNRPLGPEGLPNTVWYDLQRSGRRVFGTTLTLTRADGEQTSLSSTLVDFPDLGRRVQEETYRRLFTQFWAELVDGKSLEFGPVSCNRDGIEVGKLSLHWIDVAAVERAADKLELKRTGKKRAWAKCDLAEVVNLHVLMGIVEAARARKHTV